MGFLSYFLLALLNLLEIFLVVRCVLSWLPDLQRSHIGEFIYMMTDPLVMPFQAIFRNFDFFRTIPIDFSPLFSFMVLQVLQNMIR